MTSTEIDRPTATALQAILGPLEHLRLVPQEWNEVLYTLRWFVGGSLESVVFLTEVPGTSTDEHRVYWLRGKTFGCLVIGAHQGPQGVHEQPTRLKGYVRPISDIRRLELQDVQITRPHFGVTTVPDLEPTVVVHFDDDEEIVVSVASRTNGPARQQAAAFIDSLQAALAGA